MKLYEAWFGRIGYNVAVGNGVNLFSNFQYQDRMPLENLPSPQYWRNIEGRGFKSNYPTEILSKNFIQHQAAIFTIGATWRPGSKYIELPDRKFSIGSKYPTFSTTITQGIKNLLGSDVDYTKWNFSMNDNLNLKLGGRLSYRFTAGGFLNDKQVYIQDYQHFSGNRIAIASNYLSSFQLMPYYEYSNTANFYSTAHVEYHLNGLLTNKIPLLRKWNWFFVVGGNAMFIKPDLKYYEAMFSIENIFKIIRIDFVQAFLSNNQQTSGIRFSLPGFLSSKLED